MVSYALSFLAAATVVLGATPPGFQPGSGNELIVDFGNVVVNGQVVPKNDVQSQPSIGTQQRLPGNEFAIIMVDLDIPTNNPRQTTTLLHWLQTGLTQSAQPQRLGSQNNVFRLENSRNAAADAPYIAPNPPARLPLSHRYAQLLVDTSGIQAQATNALQNAARTRQSFNVEQVLSEAGLAGRVVAGNFFNVTNPGPLGKVNDDGSSTADPDSSSGVQDLSPSATTDSSGAYPDSTEPAAAASGNTLSNAAGAGFAPQAVLAGLVAVGAMFLRF